MSIPSQSASEGEILPHQRRPPAEAYSPEQARRRREFSVWDPRSAPGTYILLAVNIGVFLWMVAHGVDPRDPSERSCSITARTTLASSFTASGIACSPPPLSTSASPPRQ